MLHSTTIPSIRIKNIALLLLLCLPSIQLFAQNGVMINYGLGGKDDSAILELKSADQGFLAPKIALTSTTATTPIYNNAPADGLIVYNTANVNDVIPGYYYWDGTKWTRLLNGSSAPPTGSGTPNKVVKWTPTGSELGDSQIWDNGTNVGIGITPTQKLDVDGITLSKGFQTRAGNASYHQFVRTGGGAAVYINQTDNTNPILRLSAGTPTANVGVVATFENNGNVGFGVPSPSQKLDVAGDINTSTGFRIGNTATSGQYLRGNGTQFVSSAIQVADIPTLNQATTGQAGSVSNSVTFNDAGSGDASGITYNGSAVRTISYNTIGAPSTTGTNASGTWNIALTSFDTRAVATTPQSFSKSIRFDFKSNTTNGLSDGGTFNGVMYWRKYGSTITDWTGGGAQEIAYTDNGNLWHRYGTSTTWGSWSKILDNNNFASTILANPTGTIGLTPVNGSATTALRSDGAPALSQAIIPAWTGTHTFNNGTYSALFMGGNVGIATTAPVFRLHIKGGNANTEQMTLGATTTGNFALTSQDGGAYGLYAGVGNTGNAWLQAGRHNTATAYNLILQASGGNVGIGTTIPLAKLQIGVDNPAEPGTVGSLTPAVRILGTQNNTTEASILRLVRPTNSSNFYPAAVDFKMSSYGTPGPPSFLPKTQLTLGLKATSGYQEDFVDVMTLRDNGNVGIGISNPTSTLDVNGLVRVRGGSPATGKVLTSTDANGNATWSDPSSVSNTVSKATNWGHYVKTAIAGSAPLMLNVQVKGNNSYWNGTFLLQGTNSYTPNETWNNAKLISWQGYNASDDDVQALIMSNTATNSYGSTEVVIKSNAIAGGAAATINVTATGINASTIVLVSSAAVPYTYTMATSENTYSVYQMESGNVGVGTSSPAEKLDVNGNARVSGYLLVGSPTGTEAAYSSYWWRSRYDVDILDNDGNGTISTCNVGATGIITTLNIYTDIRHSYKGDLIVDVYHPDGTSSRIWNRAGGSGNDISQWFNNLTVFNGKPAKGAWTLWVGDFSNNDDGYINDWIVAATTAAWSRGTGDIIASGRLVAGGNKVMGDMAEFFTSADDLQSGQVVEVANNQQGDVVLSSKGYSASVLGVVTTDPTLILNSSAGGYPIALEGRVPVFVTDEGGMIKKGEYITSSHILGVARKATHSGHCIGIAMEDQKYPSDKIIVLLQRGWVDIGMQIQQSKKISDGGKTILENVNKVSVLFKEDFSGIDKDQIFVTLTPVDAPATLWVSDITETGFTIHSKSEEPNMVTVNWNASATRVIESEYEIASEQDEKEMKSKMDKMLAQASLNRKGDEHEDNFGPLLPYEIKPEIETTPETYEETVARYSMEFKNYKAKGGKDISGFEANMNAKLVVIKAELGRP